MKQTPWIRLLNLLATTALAVSVGCGRGNPRTEAQPPQFAEIAPVDELDGDCVGEMEWYCEDMDLERCEDVGCEIRVYEEEDYRMCFSESPRECAELEVEELCEQVRDCEWMDR